MVKYTYKLFITAQKSSLFLSEYAIDLTEEEENNPHNKLWEERQRIREALQQKTNIWLDDESLEIIIKTWTQDIKEGYRDTNLSLDLPIITQAVDYLEGSSYQQPHEVILPNINHDISELIPPYINKVPELVPPDIRDIEPTIGVLPPLDF